MNMENLNTIAIYAGLLLAGLVVFRIARYFYRKASMYQFVKKYEIEKYEGEMLKQRLEIISESDVTPDLHKKNALKLLSEYQDLIDEKLYRKANHAFARKYKLKSFENIEQALEKLHSITDDPNNPKDDVEKAKEIIEVLQENRKLFKSKNDV